VPTTPINKHVTNALFSPLSYGLALLLSMAVGVIFFIANNTTIPAPLPPEENYIPALKVNFDQCTTGKYWITVNGWALLDRPDSATKIHLFATGPGGSIKLTTRRLQRKDVSDFLKIHSDFHLHGFYASAIGRNLSQRYGEKVKIFIEDSKGLIHYGGENVCTAN